MLSPHGPHISGGGGGGISAEGRVSVPLALRPPAVGMQQAPRVYPLGALGRPGALNLA